MPRKSSKKSKKIRGNGLDEIDIQIYEDNNILIIDALQDEEDNFGKKKGIQGYRNSCYLDATLFSLFWCTFVLDDILFRPKQHDDICDYEEVQRVLRDEIIIPLREKKYVSAGQIMKLRKYLDRFSSVTGFLDEEKDPEELWQALFSEILNVKPFLKLNSGFGSFHYQIFVEKDENLVVPTVQQLFDQSILFNDTKFEEIPSCLILQMPRFGKDYKMYENILPSVMLDITDAIQGSGAGRRLEGIQNEFALHGDDSRHFMELFAVLCIKTSHYVTFAKCESRESPWCFFDSMAHKKKGGTCIPEVVACPEISEWLSDIEKGLSLLENEDSNNNEQHYARTLLSDVYICMYKK